MCTLFTSYLLLLFLTRRIVREECAKIFPDPLLNLFNLYTIHQYRVANNFSKDLYTELYSIYKKKWGEGGLSPQALVTLRLWIHMAPSTSTRVTSAHESRVDSNTLKFELCQPRGSRFDEQQGLSLWPNNKCHLESTLHLREYKYIGVVSDCYFDVVR